MQIICTCILGLGREILPTLGYLNLDPQGFRVGSLCIYIYICIYARIYVYMMEEELGIQYIYIYASI